MWRKGGLLEEGITRPCKARSEDRLLPRITIGFLHWVWVCCQRRGGGWLRTIYIGHFVASHSPTLRDLSNPSLTQLRWRCFDLINQSSNQSTSRDSSTILCLSIKYHILDSNGVLYCWFWSEWSINSPKSKMLVFNFVPRGFEWYLNGGALCAVIWGPSRDLAIWCSSLLHCSGNFFVGPGSVGQGKSGAWSKENTFAYCALVGL